MSPRPLRFATINTWKNEGDYEARLGALAIGLEELRPDVLLLQEVFRALDGTADTGRALAGELGLELAYAPARRKLRRWHGQDVPSESGLAVLVRGDIDALDRVALPSDERGGERIALFVRATSATGATMMVCCTHLSHLRGDSARRREQLDAVLAHEWWRQPARMRILGGDFNATVDSPELSWLAMHQELRLTDVFPADAARRVTHPMPARIGRAARCIDFLFTVTPRGEPAQVVRRAAVALAAPIGGVWPSDHAGIFADVGP